MRTNTPTLRIGLCAIAALGLSLPAYSGTAIVGTTTIEAGVTPATVLKKDQTLNMAINFGTTTATTVNTIAFTSFLPTTNGANTTAGGLTLTANSQSGVGWRNVDWTGLWSNADVWQNLMKGITDSGHSDQPNGQDINFTVSGLDSGKTYRFQFLFGDTRTGPGTPPESVFELNQDGTLQNVTIGGGGATDGMIVESTVAGVTSSTFNLQNNQNIAGHNAASISGLVIHTLAPGLLGPATVSGTSNGTPSTLPVTIVNGGGTSYDITGASFSGANAGDFSNGTTLPLSIPAGSNANVTVNVNPAAGGIRTATLTLTTTDPAVPTIDVPLSMTVTDPEIAIDSVLDFGNTPASSVPVTGNVFVDNNGGATNLTVSSPVITGSGASAFSVTSLPAPIAPGSFDSVVVTFNPSTPGYYAAQLELTTNDPFTPTVTVQLTGEDTGNMISPVTVASVSSENIFGYNFDADNTINGSGMTGLGSAGSSHSIGEIALVWITRGNIDTPNDLSPTITYDLGAVHHVTKIREWGLNDPTVNLVLGTPSRINGPNLVEILTSTDNVNFISAGTVNFALAPGTAGYTGNEITVNLPAVRYLRFAMKSNHAGAIFDGTGTNPGTTDNRGLIGLSEVRFEGTPSTATPFELWLDSRSLAGADRAPDADPENDGIPNLVEYVIGGNPNVSDTGKLPQSAVSGGNLTVSFTRPDTVAGVAIRFDVGTDLITWPDRFTVGTSPEVSVAPNGDSPDTITLTLPQSGHPKRFARLVVEPAP